MNDLCADSPQPIESGGLSVWACRKVVSSGQFQEGRLEEMTSAASGLSRHSIADPLAERCPARAVLRH